MKINPYSSFSLKPLPLTFYTQTPPKSQPTQDEPKRRYWDYEAKAGIEDGELWVHGRSTYFSDADSIYLIDNKGRAKVRGGWCPDFEDVEGEYLDIYNKAKAECDKNGGNIPDKTAMLLFEEISNKRDALVSKNRKS